MMPQRALPALTIWQPWASLIIEGAKPYEFRGWLPPRRLVGQRIAIHAGARPVRLAEVRALLLRLAGDDAWRTRLIPEIARPVLDAARAACAPLPLLAAAPPGLPLSAVLGTAILGMPTKNPIVDGHHLIEDSDRTDHLNWGWPLTGIERFDMPVPARGAQGFWTWSRSDA